MIPSAEAVSLLGRPDLFSHNDLEYGLDTAHQAVYFTGQQPGARWAIKFEQINRQTVCVITSIGGLPTILNREQRELFTRTTESLDGTAVPVYRFAQGNGDFSLETALQAPSTPNAQTAFTPGHHLYNPLKRTQEQNLLAQNITKEAVAEFLRNHSVIFYMGPEVSHAGKPNAARIALAIGAGSTSENSLLVMQRVLSNPTNCLNIVGSLFSEFIHEGPTLAHWALRQMAIKRASKIVTNSFDLRMGKSGIAPIVLHADSLAKCAPELAKIDLVFCAGVPADDYGFLGWFKANNPAGIIITITNNDKPKYLGAEDFYLKCNLQEILWEIAQLVG